MYGVFTNGANMTRTMTEAEIANWQDRYTTEETARMAAVSRMTPRGGTGRPLPLRYRVAERVMDSIALAVTL